MRMRVRLRMRVAVNPGTTLTTPGGKPASFTSWATARPLKNIAIIMIMIRMIIILILILFLLIIIAEYICILT